MKSIPADKLISEIERRMSENIELAKTADCFGHRAVEDNDILALIDSLQQDETQEDKMLCSQVWWEEQGWIMIPPDATIEGIDSLLRQVKKKLQQEQPDLPGIEEPGIPGKDYIPVEWVDTCEEYGKWKIVKQEQPEVDFETEYAKFSNDPDALDYAFPIDLADYKDFARHFYELGLNARKEENK